jgi:hypothetical protein
MVTRGKRREKELEDTGERIASYRETVLPRKLAARRVEIEVAAVRNDKVFFFFFCTASSR